VNVLSGILFLIAFIPYIIAILHGETIPSPVSWAIWASVDTIALIAMRKEGAMSGQLTGAVLGAWVVTVFAIIFGRPEMGSIEWVSIVGAIIGILLWWKTGDAVLAIICSQIAVLAGAIPTIAEAYINPAHEDPIAWSIWLLSCIFAFLAIKKWNVANVLQPLAFIIIDITMFALVVLRPAFI